MWGIFGKPLKWATWNTLGLHAVLTTCLRFSSGMKSFWPKTALFPVKKQGHFRPNSFCVGTGIFTYWWDRPWPQAHFQALFMQISKSINIPPL